MATIREAFEYASQNPDSDFAKQFGMEIATGKHDEEARQAGIDVTPVKNYYAPKLQKKQTLTEKMQGDRKSVV